LRNGSAGFSSLCTLNSTFDCLAIESSPWAVFAFGISVSTLAASWFLAMLIAGVFLFVDSYREKATNLLVAASAICSVASVFYFFIMVTQIKKYCPTCLTIDLISFALLGLSLSIKKSLGAEKKSDPSESSYGTLVATCGGLFVLSLFGILGAFQTGGAKLKKADIEYMGETVLRSAVVSIPDAENPQTLGPKDAKVRIVKFSDFQCPSCKNGAQTLHPILLQFGDKIRYDFRNFPLSSICNRQVQSKMHEFACDAAKAALCANQKGKFKEVYEKIFENQANLSAALIQKFGTEAGFSAEELNTCMASEPVLKALSQDIETGVTLNVQSTPTFFINGHRVEGAYPMEVWAYIIEKLLK
jgi:protein-disulfide isomerase